MRVVSTAVCLLLFAALASAATSGEDAPHCESVPQNLINGPLGVLFAQWQNKDTDSCSGCTKLSGACAWCKKGRVTNIKALGASLSDITLEDFCWPGTPWFLVNSTYEDSDNIAIEAFEIVCDDDTYNFQCGVTGKAFVGIFSSLIALCCCCCCVAFCYCICRRGRRHHHHHGYQQL